MDYTELLKQIYCVKQSEPLLEKACSRATGAEIGKQMIVGLVKLSRLKVTELQHSNCRSPPGSMVHKGSGEALMEAEFLPSLL